MNRWEISIGVVAGAVIMVLMGWQFKAATDFAGRVKGEKKDNVVVLMVTGDVMLGRYVNATTVARNDFEWPWRKTAAWLRQADLTFINLESPILRDCPVTNSGMKFCGNGRQGQGLQTAGVDVASLANNHAENYGVGGLLQTVAELEAVGIKGAGMQDPVILERRGVKFAFLAYNDVGSTSQRQVQAANEIKIRNDIQRVKKVSDVVVVMYHWGNEYTHQPTKRQRYLGRLAVDAGAQLVVGNHPHWVQPIEKYNNGVIAYSHGNFIFDQNWSRKTSQGVVGKYIFEGSRLVAMDFIPIVIEKNSQPRLASEAEAISIKQILELGEK